MGTHPIFESDFDCLTVMFELEVVIPFENSRHANIALNSLIQDREPRSGSKLERILAVTEKNLTVKWTAEEARILRTSCTSFFQLLSLVVETIEEFGEDYFCRAK